MYAEEKTLILRDGTELYLKLAERSCSTWIIHTHGIGEYSGRHQYIQEMFGHNFNILQYDIRGHGKSGGRRAYVENFYDYMKDLGEIISYLRLNFKMNEYVLMGHSMGSLITAGFLQTYASKDFYPKLVHLNAPPVSFGGPIEMIAKYMPTGFFKNLSLIPFGFNLSGLVNLSLLSHDKRVKDEYIQDPLNCLGAHTKLLMGLASASKEVFARPIRPNCPAYISIGTADKIVSYSECVQYFSVIEKGFRLKTFKDAYHEMQNETDMYRIPYFDYLKPIIESSL